MRLLPGTTLLLLLSLAFLTGCGGNHPPLSSVSGVVTLDGKPVEGANVTFSPTDFEARSATGFTDAQGRYELFYDVGVEGAASGAYDVRISKRDDEDPEKGNMEQLPVRYNDETTLKKEVKDGDNTFDFALTSKANG